MTHWTPTRRQALAGISAGAASLALPGAALAVPDAKALLDRIAWRLLEDGPEGATSLGIDTGAHAHLRSRLEDRSPAGVAAKAALLKKALREVAAVPEAGLDPATQTSLAVVKSAFKTALDGYALPYGDVAVGGWRNTPYVVIQNVGAYLDTPRFLDGDHPVKSAEDAEAYLSRLGQMPRQLDGELARMRRATAKGLIPPDFLLDKAIRQMEETIADARTGKSGMVQSLVSRTQTIPGDWGKRAGAILTASIVPALQRQLAELKRQRARATSEAGMWSRPHGPEWYAWGLRASTTTRHSPAEIHQIGVQQLAELHARMDVILRKEGFTSGTIAERITAMQVDPRYAFSTGDEGRKAIVAYMSAKIEQIRAKMPLAFRRLVSGRLEIKRLPLAEEAGAPPAYGGPGSIDGKEPGKIWVNLRDTAMHNRVTVPDLVFHEGIPGHVWQGEYTRQMPLIRSILAFNAYSEGWALYSEQLADELGVYDDDPAGRLGYLQGFCWRAARLIVDTGMHAKGWSRERALAEFTAATGLPASTAASEVDRYCSWPGQACGYKMGQNEINAQRARAQAALGAKYDLRDFNQTVVDGGNVPLDVLALNVDRYIAG